MSHPVYLAGNRGGAGAADAILCRNGWRHANCSHVTRRLVTWPQATLTDECESVCGWVQRHFLFLQRINTIVS